MESSLRERFARLGPIRAIERVACGSPVELSLGVAHDLPTLRPVTAALALVRRGMSMLDAKRAVETVIEHGRAAVSVPLVEDAQRLQTELAAAGFSAASPDTEDRRLTAGAAPGFENA